MIAYPDGTAQFLTVGQMYDQRALCKIRENRRLRR